jgi:hypothetical protein
MFDQLAILFGNRAQGTLANILDSGPRTGQAECVGWIPADMSVGGTTFSGFATFRLADPWLYGPTVSSSVTPNATASVGAVVTNPIPAATRSSFALAMTGVISGQPIIVGTVNTLGTAVAVTGIADTFGGHYTWVKVDNSFGDTEMWIGTGGTGTSGTVTVTMASAVAAGGWAVPLQGASVGVGLAAVDVHGNATATPGPATLALTPTAVGEIAIYAGMACTNVNLSAWPGAPWLSNQLLYSPLSRHVGDLDIYLGPASGSPLSGTWNANTRTSCVGCIVKASGVAGTVFSVTNPGTVKAESMTIDILGPMSSPVILNATNGVQLAFGGVVVAGTHLLIDTGAFTCLNAGVNAIGSLSHAGDNRFMALEPGANSLQITGSGATGATLATVSFAPPYQ